MFRYNQISIKYKIILVQSMVVFVAIILSLISNSYVMDRILLSSIEEDLSLKAKMVKNNIVLFNNQLINQVKSSASVYEKYETQNLDLHEIDFFPTHPEHSPQFTFIKTGNSLDKPLHFDQKACKESKVHTLIMIAPHI